MKKNYFVTDHQYINTGGNCMVSIFSVFDKQQNVTRFIIINEEGVNYQTADTVSGDLQESWEDDYDSFILWDYTWDSITEQRLATYPLDKELIELAIDCRFEYLKKDCKYFNTTVNVTYDELPQRLLSTLSPECVAWHIENEQLFTTNGYIVSPSEYYRPAAVDKERKATTEFMSWLNDMVCDDESRESLYDESIRIELGGHSVTIPFNADTYDSLECLLKVALEDA